MRKPTASPTAHGPGVRGTAVVALASALIPFARASDPAAAPAFACRPGGVPHTVGTEVSPPERRIGQFPFVDVFSNAPLPRNVIQAAADQVTATFKADGAERGQGMSPGSRLKLTLLDDSGFATVYGRRTAGVTLGPSEVSLPLSSVLHPNPSTRNTIAHELIHIWQKWTKGNDAQVPGVTTEGGAILVGDSTEAREAPHDSDLSYVGARLAQLTPAEASRALNAGRTESSLVKDGTCIVRDEMVGGLFVAWLGQHHAGGAGVSAQLADVERRVGAGVTFPQAWVQQFRESYAASLQGFLTFLHDTQRNPSQRLAQTPWALP